MVLPPVCPVALSISCGAAESMIEAKPEWLQMSQSVRVACAGALFCPHIFGMGVVFVVAEAWSESIS